jgi:hypothetical protein
VRRLSASDVSQRQQSLAGRQNHHTLKTPLNHPKFLTDYQLGIKSIDIIVFPWYFSSNKNNRFYRFIRQGVSATQAQWTV